MAETVVSPPKPFVICMHWVPALIREVWHLHFLLDPTFLPLHNYHGRQEVGDSTPDQIAVCMYISIGYWLCWSFSLVAPSPPPLLRQVTGCVWILAVIITMFVYSAVCGVWSAALKVKYLQSLYVYYIHTYVLHYIHTTKWFWTSSLYWNGESHVLYTVSNHTRLCCSNTVITRDSAVPIL